MQKLVFLSSIALTTAAFAAPSPSQPLKNEATVWQEPTTGMTFVSIPKGCFKMGAEKPQGPHPEIFWERVGYTKTASEDERPVHEVCVSPFWLGKYEVRMSEWQRVMDGPLPETGGLPVSGITWEEAEEFVRRLTELSQGKYRFRLPTEAEWEYACRAGNAKDIDPLSDGANGFAWYQFSTPAPQPVGQFRPNAFGIHDMLGNVWEWMADHYNANGYARHALFDPVIKQEAKAGALQRVLRGGSFRTERVQVRCAMRGHYAPEMRLNSIGLRLVRER
jgi:formylglycine-generating enzyme required for sulfatase activity